MGDAGGGMAIALGIRGRGVLTEGRILLGVRPPPTLGIRPPRPGLGVENGDPGGRVGEGIVREL